MTTQPAAAAIGANFWLILPPAEKKADFDPRERMLSEHLHGMGFPPEFEFLAQRSFRRQKRQRLHREFSFLQNGKHLVADGAGRADHGHMILAHGGIQPP